MILLCDVGVSRALCALVIVSSPLLSSAVPSTEAREAGKRVELELGLGRQAYVLLLCREAGGY